MKALSVVLLICAVWAFSADDKFLSLVEAKRKWGSAKFDASKFKSSEKDPLKRAPLAVDLLENKQFVGKKMLDIRNELGTPDGYYFSDTILAYKIQALKDKGHESWQLIFIPDDNIEKVKEIRIHKECCTK